MTRDEILQKHSAKRSQCATYTRVMGYIRPVESFNAGKVGEFNERVMYDEKICLKNYENDI